MEMAASEDQSWTCGNPWPYIFCLSRLSAMGDPWDKSEWDEQWMQWGAQESQQWAGSSQKSVEQTTRSFAGKGKRLLEATKGVSSTRPPAKKLQKGGICCLLNSALGGFQYGRDCIFTHRCINCGGVNEHGWLPCPLPPKPI